MSEITGVHILVGRVLVAHLPSVRRGRWRGDEEQLIELRGFEQLLAMSLFLAQDRGRLAKVDAGAHVAVQQASTLEHFAHGDGVFIGVERADDAAERRERREGVQAGHDGDLVADTFERRRLEENEIV